MKSWITKILLLLLLYIVSNLFLFKPGLWLYSDASYWYKNSSELLTALFWQVSTFINGSYYLGYDLNVFALTRAFPLLISGFYYSLFGSTVSQILYIGSAYFLSVICFYVFSGLFIEQKFARYVIALAFVNNPLFFNLLNQGYIYIYFATPLYLWSLHKYIVSERKKISYLVLNIISLYCLVQYIRLFEALILVIGIYVLCIAYTNKNRISLKKTWLYITSIFISFIPFLLNILFVLFQTKQNGAKHFVQLNGSTLWKIPFQETLNLFPNINIPLYTAHIYAQVSLIICLAVGIGCLLFRFTNIRTWWIHIGIVVGGYVLLNLGNFSLGNTIFHTTRGLLDFLQNGPQYALYIMEIPLLLLVGFWISQYKKYFTFITGIFICTAVAPLLLQLSSPILEKLEVSRIPSDYRHYFIDPHFTFAEATYYVPFYCWPESYTKSLPTPCLNYTLAYPPIQGNNARLLFNNSYDVSRALTLINEPTFKNLQITHNLKNIILAQDIPMTDETTKKVSHFGSLLAEDPSIEKAYSGNFAVYQFKNKNLYDFFIYAPLTIVYKQVAQILDNSLSVADRPVLLDTPIPVTPSENLSVLYKAMRYNQTEYIVKVMGLHTHDPFILQFNQTYSPGWKAKIVPASYFETKQCITKEEHFFISATTRCLISGNTFSTNDLSLLRTPTIPETDHIMGNLINNAWIIRPTSVAPIYLVLVFERQIYVFWGMIATGIFLFVLCCLSVSEIYKDIFSSRR